MGLLLSLALGYALGTGVHVADQAVIAAEVKEIDTIEKFRQERQQLRQMQLSQLNEIIYNENTEAEIVAREARQWSAEKKLEAADVVFINNGGAEFLFRQIDDFIKEFYI